MESSIKKLSFTELAFYLDELLIKLINFVEHYSTYNSLKSSISIVLCLIVSSVMAQLGTEHYFPPMTFAGNSYHLYISTPIEEDVVVTVTDGGGNAVTGSPFTISNGNPVIIENTEVSLSKMSVISSEYSQVVSNKGLILTGTGEFYANFRSHLGLQGAFIVSKADLALGNEFRIGNFPSIGSTKKRVFASIMATEDNTNVTIDEFDTNVIFRSEFASDITDDSFNFVLNRGETYTFIAFANIEINKTGLIGAKITSDKNISVICGNTFGGVSDGGNDYLLDQIIPESNLGNEYIVVRANGNDNMEQSQIIAIEDNTQIFINGSTTPYATLNQGEYTMITSDNFQGVNHSNMYINSDKNFYVYQYMGGRPSAANGDMFFMLPLNCMYQKTIDSIPDISNIGDTEFESSIIIIANKVDGNNPNILLNGSALTETPENVAGNDDWVTYKFDFLPADIKLESEAPIGFGLAADIISVGYGGFFSGYGLNQQESATASFCESISVDVISLLNQENNTNIPTNGSWSPSFSSNGNIFNSDVDDDSITYIYKYTNDGCEFIDLEVVFDIISSPLTSDINPN